MSKISDIYEEIKQQQYLLVKTKLQESIRANLDERTLSEQEQRDILLINLMFLEH